MMKMNFVAPALISSIVLLGTAASAQEAPENPADHHTAPDYQTIPWPPAERTFDAPQNWPIPHPGPTLDIHAIPPAVVFRSLSERERKAVQRSMAEVGYYAGPIDGVWGPMTWEGTRQYAIRVGLAERLSSTAGSLRVFQHIAN